MKEIIAAIQAGKHLDRSTAREVFDRVMSGQVPAAELGALLCALHNKGETVDELIGAAEAMRAAAVRIRCECPCLCTCGTGGDGISTFNVSTTSAIIAAAAGAVVAKHGNRTNTRVSGSAEVLSALGVNIDADVATVEACLRDIGLAFLYARNLHPAMKHAAVVRQTLRARTIFNLLGPLCNPAGATRQVLGVSRPDHLELMAGALRELGCERAWVVHSRDGLCDLSITGTTEVCELRAGGLRRFVLSPADAGLAESPLAALLVGSTAESAEAVRDILAGKEGPRRDHALLNAGAALVVAGLNEDIRAGVARAAKAVDSGAALGKLDSLAERTSSSSSN